jgi:hypothetical protein
MKTHRIISVLAGFLLCAAPARAEPPTPLQSRIDATADALAHEQRLAHFSEARRTAVTRFVAGNLLFVLLHELGHALITELGLPVLGREEDAADSFASITMIGMKNEFSERVLAEAARGWFLSDASERRANAPILFYDAHSLSRQRAYQIVCYLVGSDPARFATLAHETGLPPDRRASCVGDFSNAMWSWERVLAPHLRGEGPRTEITVRYGEADDRTALLARAMRFTRILEIVAERTAETFALRAPLAFQARNCGTPHANWDAITRTVTICYELAADFARLFEETGPDSVATRR